MFQITTEQLGWLKSRWTNGEDIDIRIGNYVADCVDMIPPATPKDLSLILIWRGDDRGLLWKSTPINREYAKECALRAVDRASIEKSYKDEALNWLVDLALDSIFAI